MRDPWFFLQLGFVAATLGIAGVVVIEKTVRDARFAPFLLLVARGLIPAAIGAANAAEGASLIAVVWGGRLQALLLVLALAVAILTVPRRDVVALHHGRSLLLGGLAFAGGAIIASFATGKVTNSALLTFAAILIVWLSVATPEWWLRQFKVVLGIYVLGSALVMLVGLPYAAGPYEGSLIGLDFRAQGLLQHANALGPVAVLYLVLEVARPSTRWVRLGVGGTAVVLLVLAQSKTAWVAAAFVGVVLWAGHSSKGTTARLLLLCILTTTLVLALTISEDAAEFQPVDESQVDSLRTLTGRTVVWSHGLDRWRRAPLLGGGADVFQEFADRTNRTWAAQAHNQWIQTLGRHGLVGLLGLLIYVVVLVTMAIRHRSRSRYVSLALVGVLLIRTMTEANLDSFHLEQFIVFALLLAWERERTDGGRHVEADAGADQPTLLPDENVLG